MYRGDWLARKVIDIVPYDMVREWRAWAGTRVDVQAIEREERRLNLRKAVQRALTLGRLYGGAAIIIGTSRDTPADVASELDPDRIGIGDVTFLHTISRWQLNAPAIDRDPLSPWFGEAVAYEIVAPTRGAMQIHPSRVIRFLGNEWPDPSVGASVWSDSVLQTLYDAIHAVALTTTGATSLMHEAKVDVVTVPNLSEHLSSAATTAQLSARFSYAAMMKSLNNLLLLGDGETWSRQKIDFAGLPQMVQTFLQVAAGAADIPVTRLLGQSPAGLSATGDSDTRNYYDMIAARQAIDLRPKLERLDQLILRSAGVDPANVSFDFRPLWQMDAAAAAQIALNKAQTTQIYAGLKLWPADVMARLVESQLGEDGIYPGAEAIFGEAKAESVVADAEAGSAPARVGRQGAVDLFDPTQPRDPDGRWTAGAGAASSSNNSGSTTTPPGEVGGTQVQSPEASNSSSQVKSNSSSLLGNLEEAAGRVLAEVNPIGTAAAQEVPSSGEVASGAAPLPTTQAAQPAEVIVELAIKALAVIATLPYVVRLVNELQKYLPSWLTNRGSGTNPPAAPAKSVPPPQHGPGPNGAASTSSDPSPQSIEGLRPLTIHQNTGLPTGWQPALPADTPPSLQNPVANTLPQGYTSQSSPAGEKPAQAGQNNTSTAAAGAPAPEPPEDPRSKQLQEQRRKHMESTYNELNNRQLTDATLDAARTELASGEPIVWQDAATPFNHMEKVRNGQRSLLNIIDRCRSVLSSPGLVPSEVQPTIDLLRKASRLLDKSGDYFPRGSSIEFWKPRSQWTSSWSPKGSP